jgi:enoyl-CoA hydratase/carnithine racemase
MTLRLEKSGRIVHLTIDRPDKHNAFSQQMWELFPELLAEAMDDPAIRVMMVRASRKDSAFSAGADIGEFAAGADDPEWRSRNQAAIRRVQHELARAPKPTIAIVDHDCIGGGCGIAIACDIRVAGPRARFGITPAKLGLVYSLHDTKLLVDLVGPSQAKRILFTGQLMSAEEARDIGLVTILAGDPHEEAASLAETMISVSAHSQIMSKAIVRRILDGQADDDAETEAQFADAFQGEDFIRGAAAFLGKQQPEFK